MGPIAQNAIGGFIASGVYGVLALVLIRIKEEIKLARDCKQELQELEEQLNGLNDLLQGPYILSNNNALMHKWLNKVNNEAHNVDDLLDDYSYDALKHESITRKRDKLNDLLMCPIEALKFGHRARDLRQRIDSIYKEGQKLGIRPIQVVDLRIESRDQRLQDQREWVNDQSLVGRDEDMIRVVDFLCSHDNSSKDLSVIGIIGLPGLGKTALSKRLSKAQEVITHFNSHIFWLVVSHIFDLTNILKRMVEQLSESSSTMFDTQAMLKKLREKLKGKRYLVILDDVWDTIDWAPLICALYEIGGSKGTTILVTSSDKNVLEKMDTYGTDYGFHKVVIHQLEGLSMENSWSLFLQRVGGKDLVGGEKQRVGSRMIKKCGGNPHAIRTIGDSLRGKDVEEWKDFERTMEGYKILPSLKLSYMYLPMALKKCFTYCAIFREDEVILKDKLIQMWMGQGFLQPYDNMERVGEDYVRILLNNFLFGNAKVDELGNVVTFKIHSLVLSLARVASAKECLNLYEPINLVENSSRTEFRHLSSSLSFSEHVINFKFCEKLRSYLYFDPTFGHKMLKSLDLMMKCSKCLRVLCLQHLGLENLPHAIGELKHLRYLDISENCFETLPILITSLFHLQTLRIDYNTKTKLGCSIPQEKVINLRNLRHISAKSVNFGIFKGIGHLTNLRTLTTINLESNWGGEITELASLTNLHDNLGIKGVQCIKYDEVGTLVLVRLFNISRFVLEWSPNLRLSNDQNLILEALEPHKKLATLEIAHYNGSRIPKWLTKTTLSNLVSLKLSNFYYAIGNLNLKNLGSLRFLSLVSCHELTVSLPKNEPCFYNSLESLKLSSCYNVGNLGDLSHLTRLQCLEIINCAKTTYELAGLVSLPCLKDVITDRLLPRDLRKESPVCKSLRSLYLSTQEEQKDLFVPLQHLLSLQELHICDLKSLEILPEWLGKLTSLSLLELSNIPRLKNLPSEYAMQRLSNLRVLSIRECPYLKKQFIDKKGEWFKINHIPSIIVDFEQLNNKKV